jgi:hypothetical protein
MEKGKTIARNREHWANMYVWEQEKAAGRTRENAEEEREQEQRQKGTPADDEPSNRDNDDTPARRRTREHTRHKPPTTNGPMTP